MLQKINRNSGQIHMLLSSFVKSNESDLFFKEIWVFMIVITMHFLHFLNRRKLDVVLLIVNYKIICYALWKCSYFMKILIYRTVLYVYIFGAWFCIQWRLVISITFWYLTFGSRSILMIFTVGRFNFCSITNWLCRIWITTKTL